MVPAVRNARLPRTAAEPVPVLPALAASGLGTSDAVAIEKPFGTDLASAMHLNDMLPRAAAQADDLPRRPLPVRRARPARHRAAVPQPGLRADLELGAHRARGHQLAGEPDARGPGLPTTEPGRSRTWCRTISWRSWPWSSWGTGPDRPKLPSGHARRGAAGRGPALPRTCARGHGPCAIHRGDDRAAAGALVHVEPGVDPRRDTETYASLTLEVENPRWAGVPFTLRSGKAMPTDSAEITIHFRPMPRYLPGPVAGRRAQRAQAGPDRALRAPGHDAERGGGGAGAGDSSCSRTPRRSAYANLVLEMLKGDATPQLIRGDEARSWHHRPGHAGLDGR